MDLFGTILSVIWLLIKAIFLSTVAIFLLQTVKILLKTPKLRNPGLTLIKYDREIHKAVLFTPAYRKLSLMYNYFRNKRLSKWFEFIKWVCIDLARGRERFELFGIWCFTGYYGEGKTLGAVNYAFGIKKSRPWMNIKIYSNFNLRGQDGKINTWKDLLELPKNTIVIFDEIQSTFTSTKFKDFPLELLWKLTQCRKQGLAIFCSSPVYTRMTIQLRESTDFVIVCKNVLKLKRMFTYSFYHAAEFERFMDDKLKLRQHRESKFCFVAQDINYRRYDTHQLVDRLDIEDEDQAVKVKGMSKSEVIKLIEDRIKQLEKKIA